MGSINITVENRPLTLLFLGILTLFLVLFMFVDILAILFFIYKLVIVVPAHGIDYEIIFFIVAGIVLLFVAYVIVLLSSGISDSLNKATYSQIQLSLDSLTKENEELIKENEELTKENEKLEDTLEEARI